MRHYRLSAADVLLRHHYQSSEAVATAITILEARLASLCTDCTAERVATELFNLRRIWEADLADLKRILPGMPPAKRRGPRLKEE